MKFLKTQVLTVVLLLTSVAAWGQEVTCPELNQVADQGELKACLDSNNVQTIVIIGDFEITPVTIYRTVTIKSDATTRTLTRAAPGSLFFVDEGAALTLENIIIDGGGENITGANGPLVDVNGAGRSLEMRAGTVLRNNVSRNANAAGGAVLLRFGASFTMNGGEISGNTATWGGGVVVWTNNDAKSTFIMNGGIIRNNEAKGDGTYDDGGGGVIVENSIFVMNGGEISGNFANQTGGGVTVSKSSTFTLGGTAKIFGNTLANKTTASNVYLLTQDLYITLGTGADGTSIPTAGMNVGVNTVAANNGIIAAGASSGAEQHFFSDDPNQFVVWEGNQLKLAPRCPDGSIVNNHPNLAKCIADYATATNNMTINIGYDFNVTAPLSISGNSNGRTLTIKSSDATTRTLMRGAAATGNLFTVSANASLIFENLVVDGNKGNVADIVGSLVMVNGNFEMKAGAVLRNNTISGYGSGVHVSGGTFTMHGGEISGNTTSTGGGGMYANSSGTFIMHGGTISGNKAAWGGGVNVLGTFTMNGGTVYGNEAEHGDLGNTATGGGASILVEGTAQAQYGGALASYGAITTTDNTLPKPPVTVNGPSGTQGFGNLTDALASITTAGDYTVRISENQTIAPTTFPVNTNITLEAANTANPVTISLSANGSMFTVNSDVTLTLTEGVTLQGHSGNAASLVMVNTDGIFEMSGGAITGNIVPGTGIISAGVHIAGGTFTMSGGKISGNEGFTGGGVRAQGGRFIMIDGEISGNKAAVGGGVIVDAAGGIFEMKGGEISGNTATGYGVEFGGGVYVGNVGGATFTMSGGIIYGNEEKHGDRRNNAPSGASIFVMPNGIATYIGSVGSVNITTTNLTFPSPGTIAEPFLIYTEDDLRKVGTGVDGWTLSAHYKLAADIPLAGGDWVPIGNNANQFTGGFDGGGHTITGITVNAPTIDFQGMFGAIGAGGEVKNLGLVNVNVTGQNFVGGLAGLNYSGKVEYSYATGTVSGIGRVGGLVGENQGTVENCYADSDVIGSDEFVGGVVGVNYSIVQNCYAMGKVSGVGGNGSIGDGGIGGVVGSSANSTTVKNCVALNESLSRASGEGVDFGRVVGSFGTIGAARENNFAWSGITLPSGVTVTSNAAGIHGADITSDNHATLWTTLGFTDPWWAVPDRLPDLTAYLPQLPTVFVDGPSGTQGFDNLADALASITAAGDYTVRISEDQTLAGHTTTQTARENFLNVSGANITIKSDATTRTIMRSAKEYLFTVGAGVSLIFENVVVDGNKGNITDSDGALVRVMGGEFEMRDGAVLQNNAGRWSNGGGVSVVSGAFTMTGGEIRGNGVDPGYNGGGVYIDANGTFTKTGGGTIYGSNDGANANIATSGHAVYFAGTPPNIRTLTAEPAQEMTTTLAGSPGGWDVLGTEGDPFLVNNELDLLKVGKGADGWGLAAHYKLVGNITLTGGNWVPIGSDANRFTGSFDGNNHTITGLTITGTANSQGMFGVIGEDGIVKKLGLVNVNISGNEGVGGVAGTNRGTVQNCYSTGSISGGGGTGIGGVVGYNFAEVSNSYSTSNISGGNGEGVGGVVGSNYFNAAGSHSGVVSNSYSTGSVSGNKSVGGIVGYNQGTVQNNIALNSSIERTSGTDTNFGRVIGDNDGGTLTNNHAFFEMLNKDNTTEWDNKGESSIDGADITITEIASNDGTFGNRFVLANGWVTEPGKLPGFDVAIDLPLYLIPKIPTVADFDFDLTAKTYTGTPQGVTVTPNVAGIGAVTVWYEGTNGTDYAKSTTASTNAGSYAITADVTEGTTYSAATGLVIGNFTIEKAIPAYTTPTNLIATYGDLLSSVTLPSGWAWETGAVSVGEVGPQMHKATFTPSDPNNYNIVSNIDVTITVSKAAAPTITFPTANPITYGALLSTSTLTGGSTELGSFDWETDSIVPIVANNGYEVIFTPNAATLANYNIAATLTQTVTITVAKADPAYTTPTNLTATYGDLLSSVVLPIGWTWEDDGVPVGEIGQQIHKATFTPNDQSNYNVVIGIDVTITINKPTIAFPAINPINTTYTPTLTLNTIILPTGYAWCTGSNTPLDEPLNAGNNQQFPAIYTDPSGNYEPANGNITVNVAKATPTYTTPTNLSATYGDLLSNVTLPSGWTWETGSVSVGTAGTQTHKATFTPSDQTNYSIVTDIDVTITVGKATAPAITFPIASSITYSALLSTSTLTGGSTELGSFNWEDDTIVPTVTNNGYEVIFTPNAATLANYNIAATLTQTIAITVGKANPTYTTPTNLSAIYGDLLSNVTLPNGWAWETSAVSVGEVGPQTHKATFTPSDQTNYNIVTDIDVTITVAKTTGTFPPLAAIPVTYTPTLTLNTIILPTGYAWCTGVSNTPLDEPLNAGNNQQFSAIYTHPSGNYEPANGNITVNVAKATPTYTTPTNLTATYGDLLSSVVLPIGWTWEDDGVPVGEIGQQIHKATFTPNDQSNYNVVIGIDVTITINKPTIAFPAINPINTTYTPTLTLNTIILPTGYAWCTGSNTPLDEPLNAGNNQQFPAIYTHPSGNYEPAEGNITVNVAKATPTYTTPTNLSATYGDLLSSVTLPNGWVWETGNVSVGAAGPQTHKATFTPSDPNNYNIVTNIDVTITVAKAPLTITANNQTIAYGDPIPTTFTATYEGFVNNEDETILNGTLTFETNYTQGNAIGTYEITLIQDIEHSRNVNYEITLTNGTLTVEKKQDTPGYDIVITNPDPNKEPIAVFEKDNNISNENKAIFTAGKNHCGIDKAQFQITIPDPSTELKVDGAAQAGTKDANGLTRHNINRELGKRGALDTLIYSLHKDDQELRADTAIIVTPIPFERIVRQKWDLLIINNNPQTNGGYYFTEFEWFKDGEKTDNTLQYYQFDQGAVFNAQMNTIEGIKINTCESNLIESEKETPPSVQKRLLGIGSATLPPNAKIYTPKGERSTGKTPGVYIVKE